jgi:hypothetical protein
VHRFPRLAFVCLILTIAAPAAAGCPKDVEAEVLAALDTFLLDGFNSGDPETWAGTLSYPHCRIGGPVTSVWRTPEEYAGAFDYQRQFDMGWDHSEWGSTEVLWCDQKAAFARVHYLRKRADDSILHSLHGIYTLTRQDDGWGVLARFSGLSPAQGERKTAAEEAASAALAAHLEALGEKDRGRIGASLNYPYLKLLDEVATVTDGPDEASPEGVTCGGAATLEPLLAAPGAVIIGAGFDGDGPPAVYAVTNQNRRWGVRGCSSFSAKR